MAKFELTNAETVSVYSFKVENVFNVMLYCFVIFVTYELIAWLSYGILLQIWTAIKFVGASYIGATLRTILYWRYAITAITNSYIQ